MIFNVTNGGGGSGCKLTVTAPAGVTVRIAKGSLSRTKTSDSGGKAAFTGLEGGSWTITITGGGKTASKTVTLQSDYTASISFNAIPEFTYTGDYQIVDDGGKPITTSQGNWKIRFLTSGTLKFTQLNGASEGLDVFLVGGGGGGDGEGGGGGYTKTVKAVSVAAGTAYSVTVGAGGAAGVSNKTPGGDGGTSSAFGVSAAGGSGSNSNGGSGGGSYGFLESGGAGGSDGSDGVSIGSYAAGKGQGTTTREFGEASGTLYAGGGGGGSRAPKFSTGGAGGGGDGGGGMEAYLGSKNGSPGARNTGGGGGGAGEADLEPFSGGAGGSGIVIIRNKRG